jgi:hypothetical protein
MEQFLNLAFRLEYASFREVIESLLDDAQLEMRVIAARQSSIAVLVVQEARELSAKLISGDQHVRKGLAEVCAANVRFGKVREYCAERLKELFFDVDVAVRGAASECFRNLTGDELAGLVDLVTAFLDSPSADGYLNSLLDSLKRSTVRHDLVTLRACDLAVEQVIRSEHSVYLELQLCRDLVLRTYHQSADAEIRSRSLDLIDRLLGLEVHGLEGALLEIEARR